jgi:hypothetical protein
MKPFAIENNDFTKDSVSQSFYEDVGDILVYDEIGTSIRMTLTEEIS